MKSTVVLISVNSAFLHREEVDVDTKWDAYHTAQEVATRWGLQPMKSHQTTVGFKHFVTIFGRVGRS